MIGSLGSLSKATSTKGLGTGLGGVESVGCMGSAVAAVAVTAGGSGFTVAPTVQFNAVGGGSGATGIATISGGVVTGVIVTNGGRGYTTAPTVQFNAVGG